MNPNQILSDDPRLTRLRQATARQARLRPMGFGEASNERKL